MRSFHSECVIALLVLVFVGFEGRLVLAACPPPPITFTRTAFDVEAVTDGPKVIALGDLNKDGKADIVLCSVVDDQVDIYLNDGSGGFQASAQSFPTGAGPVAVAIADFNHDGNSDLAVVASDDDVVTILLGDGAGNFNDRRDFSVSASGPISLVAADFNEDGFIDVAVMNDRQIDLLKGDGSGNFSHFAGSPISTRGADSADIVAGSLNPQVDVHVDLAVANSTDGFVTVFLGKGDGTFQQAKFNTVGAGPTAIGLADLNGDTKTDIAVVNADEIADINISLLYAKGDGTFDADVRTTAETFSNAIALADFDVDGKTDMAVTSDSGGLDLTIEHNDPDQLDGSCFDFENGFSRFALNVGNLVAVQAGQINGDGLPDLVALSSDGATVFVFTNAGGAAVPTNTPSPTPPTVTPTGTATRTPPGPPSPTTPAVTPTATGTRTPPPSTPTPRTPAQGSSSEGEGCSIDPAGGWGGLYAFILPMLIAVGWRRRQARSGLGPL